MSEKLFQQRRPAYKANTGVIKRPIVPFQKTRFVIDEDTTRPASFRYSGAKPRVPLGVGAMRKIDEQTYGAKVQLSEKTLDKLFNVRVDDPTDIEYVAKKAALESEGKSPDDVRAILGRQRQITKRVNLADASLAVGDKLELLERAVQTGFDNTSEGLSAILGQTSLLVGDGTFLDSMSPGDLTRLRDLLRDIDMPKEYSRAGFKHRIYTQPEYRDESGLVNIYLMSHLEGDRTLDAPMLGIKTRRGRFNPKLTGYLQYMTRVTQHGERYIDLEKRVFLTRTEAMSLANQGVDGGVLGGEMRPEGGWRPEVVPDWALTGNEYKQRYAQEKSESKSDERSVGMLLEDSPPPGRRRLGKSSKSSKRRGRKRNGKRNGVGSP